MCMGLEAFLHESICTHWGQKNFPLKKFHIWAAIWFPSWFPLDICEEIIFPWNLLLQIIIIPFFSWKMKIIWCQIFLSFLCPNVHKQPNTIILSFTDAMMLVLIYLLVANYFCKVTIFWKNNFFYRKIHWFVLVCK